MRRFAIGGLLVVAFAAAYMFGWGASAHAGAYAGNQYGRTTWVGYFTGTFDQFGTDVFPRSFQGGTEAMPNWINSAAPFLDFIINNQYFGNYGGTTAQRQRGAAFIMNLMLNHAAPGDYWLTGDDINNFTNMIYTAQAQGHINWRTNFTYNINSYWQGTGPWDGPIDDAFYGDSGTMPVMAFYNSAGQLAKLIKWQCANPVGWDNSLANMSYAWEVNGHTTVSSPTNAEASDITAAPGTTVTFHHYLGNAGPGDTWPQPIWWIAEQTSPSYVGLTGASNSGTHSQYTLWNVFNHDLTIPAGAAAGTQYCERVGWDPVTSWGVSNGRGTPSCVTVAISVVSSCGGVTVNPATFDPADPYSVTAIVNTTGGQAGAQNVDTNSNFYINVTGPGVAIANGNVTPVTVGGSPLSSGTGTLTASINPAATNNAGTYAVAYGITGATGAVNCTGSFNVAYTPYYSIRGGDVAAGPGFGTACTDELSDIDGKNLGAGSGYYGAGTQMAALSLGHINNFATNTTLSNLAGTGSSSSGLSALQPSGLAFSNVGVSASVWGTSFGKDPSEDPADNPSWCAPDYVSAATGNAVAPTPLGTNTLDQAKLNTLTNGTTYSVSGTTTISGALQFGGASPKRITLVVTGDVIIKGNITYAGYNYVSGTTAISSIPQFQLLVLKGHIYVDKGVQILDGFYHAQQLAATGGTIYTCASGQKYLTDDVADGAANALYDANYYADCNAPLTVYGSLAAKHVALLRTGGNWKTTALVGNQAAESIVYTPELWLGNLSDTSGGVQPYDSITSLPPIL